MSEPIALAWAAGLFEGEGSVGCYLKHRRWWQLQAEVTMTDQDVVEHFRAVVGIGTVRGPYTKKSNWLPTWSWRASGEDIRALWHLLGPYLGSRRQEQFLLSIQTWDERTVDAARSARAQGPREMGGFL